MEREITEYQRSNGDKDILRDSKITQAEEGTSSSGITNLHQFLLKNNLTGEFETYIKEYVDEAVRGALGALVNSLDKGQNITGILATGLQADNYDLGTITPANLASILSATLGIGVYFKHVRLNNYYVHVPLANAGLLIASSNAGGVIAAFNAIGGSGVNANITVTSSDFKISSNPVSAIVDVILISFSPITSIWGTDS